MSKLSPATSHEDASPLERAKLMLDAKAVIEHYDRIIETIDEHRLVLDQREADFVMTVEDYQVLRDFASRDDAPTQAINLEGVAGDEMDKSADRAALLTRLMAAGTTRSEIAPKGWKLVPEEPTKEMIVAGQDEHDNCIDTGYDSDADGNRHDYTTISPDAPSRVYLEMINAAPRGPQGSVGSGTSEGSEGNRPHPAGAAPVSVPSARGK